MHMLLERTKKHFTLCYDSRIAANSDMQENLVRYLNYHKKILDDNDTLKELKDIRTAEVSKSERAQNIFNYYQIWLASKRLDCKAEFKKFKEWFTEKRRDNIKSEKSINDKKCRDFYRAKILNSARD